MCAGVPLVACSIAILLISVGFLLVCGVLFIFFFLSLGNSVVYLLEADFCRILKFIVFFFFSSTTSHAVHFLMSMHVCGQRTYFCVIFCSTVKSFPAHHCLMCFMYFFSLWLSDCLHHEFLKFLAWWNAERNLVISHICMVVRRP